MKDLDLMLQDKLHFFTDDDIDRLMENCQNKIYDFNLERDGNKRYDILKGLFKSLGKSSINAPFHCDYGCFISVGDYCLINYDCIILDGSYVNIGDHVFIGPRVSIYTASHPISHEIRNEGYDYSLAVNIEDNVWIGGHSVINPGVRIGKNSVIGSGSVVVKDIPANCVAVGNPCKVIRNITDEDYKYWSKLRDEYLEGK